MKTLIATLIIATTTLAHATTLTVDFTEPVPGTPRLIPLGVGLIGGSHQYLFNELNGTEYLGQKISLDFNFFGASTGEQFIRVFSLTSQYLEFELQGIAQVDDLTGYVTGKNGKEIKELDPIAGSNSFGHGLFPILDPANNGDPYNPNIKTPLDIYGVHFDITLGNYPGTYLSQIGFMVVSNFEGFIPELVAPLGFGPSDFLPKDIETVDEAFYWAEATLASRVPDTGSTLGLLGMAFAVIGGLRGLTRSRICKLGE
jgi:hypothetical protein